MSIRDVNHSIVKLFPLPPLPTLNIECSSLRPPCVLLFPGGARRGSLPPCFYCRREPIVQHIFLFAVWRPQWLNWRSSGRNRLINPDISCSVAHSIYCKNSIAVKKTSSSNFRASRNWTSVLLEPTSVCHSTQPETCILDSRQKTILSHSQEREFWNSIQNALYFGNSHSLFVTFLSAQCVDISIFMAIP